MSGSCVAKILKVLIVIITTTCFWMHYFSLYDVHQDQQFVVGGCFIAFLIIGIAQVFDFLVEPFPAFTGLYFNLAGMSMFLVTACFCYAFYETSPIRLRDYNVILVKSILCAANALCYGFSGFLNFYHPHERVSSAV